MVACEHASRRDLELGGHSAAIILDDVDLEVMHRNGLLPQRWSAASAARFYRGSVLPRSRHDEIVNAACTAIGGLMMGDPFSEATDLAPLVAERQRGLVER